MGGEFNKETLKEYIVSDTPTIFDVGCYDGSDSKDFLRVFPKAQIYSFEPDQRSIELFNKNVKSDNIHLIETAISNVDGTISWYESESETRRHYDDQKSWSASSSMKKPKEHLTTFTDVYFKQPTTVKSKKLDTWYGENNVDIIDIMWVDVNGATKEFIEGAVKTLNEKTKILITEFEEVELYEGSSNLEETLKMLPNFEKIKVFNFLGNFGNVILKNNTL